MSKYEVGYEFEYQWEFVDYYKDFNKYSISSGATDSIGWENGDTLKIVHINTDNSFMVLNTVEDVLTVARIYDEDFFGEVPTAEDVKVDFLVGIMQEIKVSDLRELAKALIEVDVIK